MSRRGVSALVAVVLALALAAGAVAAVVRGDDGQSGPGSAPLPGIDASTVKVGYLVSTPGGPWGGRPTDREQSAIQAVVNHVNATGGAGGRRVEAEIVTYDVDGGMDAGALCRTLTEGHGVTVAVLDRSDTSRTPDCYATANTLVVDQGLAAHDQEQLERLAPYLWAPSAPEYGAFLRAQLGHLRDVGFLAPGQRVQLLAADDEVARRAVGTIAEPFLADLGADVRTDLLLGRSPASLAADLEKAQRLGRRDGVERALVVAGAGRVLPIALADFQARDHEALWAVSTFDNPQFLEQNELSIQVARRAGMVGLGFDPSADVATGRGPAFPDPDNPTQQRCIDLLRDAGVAPSSGSFWGGSVSSDDDERQSWRQVLRFCDATLFVDAALDRVDATNEVSAQDFADAVTRIGTDLPSAIALGSSWGPGVHAAVDTVRPLRWDEECECFDYVGDPVRLRDPDGTD